MGDRHYFESYLYLLFFEFSLFHLLKVLKLIVAIQMVIAKPMNVH